MLKFFVTTLALVASALVAAAFEVKEVKSPGGQTAWLVEDKTIPLIAFKFAFDAGSTSDPLGKDGAAHFITGMMDEGAADLDGPTFQEQRDNLAIKIRFDVTSDRFYGTLQTLSRNRKQAFDLLKKAITQPHFELEALERMRKHFIVSAQNNDKDPQQIAYREWIAAAIPGHPYGRRSEGTTEAISSITREDLINAHKTIFTRRGLKIAAVGDVDEKELATLLDDVFGSLPEGSDDKSIPMATVSAVGSLKTIPFDIPQSIIMFGQAGILQNDPDYFAAQVMSSIVGGDSQQSWLTAEVREKRGLTYGVGYNLVPMPHAGLYIGSLNTVNEKAGEAIQAVKSTLKRMADLGPTEKELSEAKSYLTGSYALRFDTDEKITDFLMALQIAGRPRDFANQRNAIIDAVTLEQVKAQAKRLLDPDKLIVVVVGKPGGLN